MSTETRMLDLLTDYLSGQGLGHERAELDVSAEVGRVLLEGALTWKVEPTGDPIDARVIIAFTFGFRFDRAGNRLPGPINEELAQAVEAHYRQRPRPVYAQWEVAEALRSSIPEFVALYPGPPDRTTGAVPHLSTRGVLEQVVDAIRPASPDELGPVLLIAHRDHLARCAKLALEMGFRILTDQDRMPGDYDPESGQLWTSTRSMFIVSEIVTRITDTRGATKRVG